MRRETAPSTRLLTREDLRLELVGRQHVGHREHLRLVEVHELLGHVAAPVVAQHGVAHVLQARVDGLELVRHLHHGPQEGGRPDVSG